MGEVGCLIGADDEVPAPPEVPPGSSRDGAAPEVEASGPHDDPVSERQLGAAGEAEVLAASSAVRELRADDAADRPRAPRRTWAEAGTITARPRDWTSFDVQSVLRGLRTANEAGQRLSLIHI